MSTVEAPATAAPQLSPRLAQFLGPRYWLTWLLVAWLRFTAILPWKAAVEIHRWIGRALWHLLPSRRFVVTRNLEVCFPELTPAARRALARRNFENVAISVAEIAIAWFSRRLPPVRIDGLNHLETALARGNGVILYSGHFTTLELTAQFVKPITPRFAFMFRSRSNPLLDVLQARGRQRTAHLSFNNGDSRAMLRALRGNAVVWYAPDQAHGAAGSELLPFFGNPAMTNTATTRLARLSGAVVVPFQFRRFAGGAGYLVSFEPPVTELPSNDATADTQRLTSILERFVRTCPEQYLWTHRRFRGRGPALPNVYERGRADQHRTGWRALLAEPLLIAAVSLFIVVADNESFWQSAWRATRNDEHALAILTTLFALVFFTLTIGLSLALGTKLLRALAVVLLLIASNCGFFMSQYGIVIDQSMIRNTVETTVLEATPLLSPAYFWHMLLYGLLPAAVVVFAPLRRVRWRAAVAVRFVTAAFGVLFLATTLYVNYAAVAFFGRDNDGLRLQINPAYPLYAAATFGMSSDEDALKTRQPLDMRLGAAPATRHKPALVVLVMGETARADRFSFNGYERDTNRYTRAHDVVNFPRVVACGTSTAESVPCIFSGLGQAHFSHKAALSRESIVGAMQRLGVSTFWRDNSTGCKNVCDEQHFEQRANWTHPDLCDTTGCFDELLLEDFDTLLADRSRDHLIVLHQRGSHGPAYHTDVPAWAKEFFPECDLPNLRNCDRASINNSYDNTILYTDYFLSRVIGELDKRSADFDTAMLYVSDHGESLGENGLYLHGFPYSMAPREQIEVPMLFWGSPAFYAERANSNPHCLRRYAQHDTSHDAIFHTLLPIFGLESPLYDEKLDLLAACRGERLSAVTNR